MKIAIIYGSTLGNTERVANLISKNFGDNTIVYNVKDLKSLDTSILNSYEAYIFGTSTWGVGDLQDDWEEYDFKNLNLENKNVAIFGLGDSEVYAWTHCDAISKLHRILKSKKANIYGYVDASNYKYAKSESVLDGKFLGLAIDEDNYEDLTEDRVKNWVIQLKEEFK